MSESIHSERDVFSTPASSMYLNPQAGGSSSNTMRSHQQHGDREEDSWTSSSGETSSLIQRKTVKKEYVVNSPRTVKRSNASSGASSNATTTPKRRKDTSSSTQTTPRARDGRNTPLAKHRSEDRFESPRKRGYVEDRAGKMTRSKKGYTTAGWTVPALQALRPLRLLVNLTCSIIGIALSPIANAISAFVLLLLMMATLYFAVRSPLNTLASFLLPSSILSITHPLFSPFTAPLRPFLPSSIKSTYCSTIGIGCEPEPLPIARLARTVADQALQAHDIFTSVVALGNPANLGLHHTEVWELAMAVKATSGLENKDRLGNTLKELGDMTRDVKDAMTGLNAQGINSFSWILHEFSRIEKTIELLQTKGSRYTPEDVSRQLDALFEHLASDLSSLLTDIERALPLAARASNLGGSVMFDLGSEHARLNRAKEDMPLWRRLKEINSFQSRQLSRDLQLTGDSVMNLKSTRRNLEEARGFLMGYRDQVAYFKASVVGFHMADHGLDPEDEVATLRDIMQKFQNSVDAAKTRKIDSSDEEL